MAQRKPSRLPRPETPRQALEASKRALLGDGEFVTTRHFKERLAGRQFDMTDVEHLAREGRILNPPEWDASHGNWTWRLEGRTVDGRTVYVVFAISGTQQVRGIAIETPER